MGSTPHKRYHIHVTGYNKLLDGSVSCYGFILPRYVFEVLCMTVVLAEIKFLCWLCDSRFKRQYIQFLSHHDRDRTCHSRDVKEVENTSLSSDFPKVTRLRFCLKGKETWDKRSPLKTILENFWRCYRGRFGWPRSRRLTKFWVRGRVDVHCISGLDDQPSVCNTIPLYRSCNHRHAYAACWELVLPSWLNGLIATWNTNNSSERLRGCLILSELEILLLGKGRKRSRYRLRPIFSYLCFKMQKITRGFWITCFEQ